MVKTSTTKEALSGDAASMVVQQRLSVLELAHELGNVAGAHRCRGMIGRTSTIAFDEIRDTESIT